MDALLTGEALATEQGKRRLHDIVKEAQEQAWHERREQWQKMRKEAQTSRLRQLAEDAGLDTNQVEQLTTFLDHEDEQRRAIFDAMTSGKKTHDQARSELRALRQSTNQQAQSLLSDQQYTAYEKMREERRGPGGRWFR